MESEIIAEAGEGKAARALIDRFYTGDLPAPEVKKSFGLLPRRWVVERSFWVGGPVPPVGKGLRTAPGDLRGASPI